METILSYCVNLESGVMVTPRSKLVVILYFLIYKSELQGDSASPPPGVNEKNLMLVWH